MAIDVRLSGRSAQPAQNQTPAEFSDHLTERIPVTAPKLQILAYEPTPLGILCLRKRELLCEPGTMVTEVTLNHEFLMSSYLTASEIALSKTGIHLHKGDSRLNVLVGGLGLGYTAHAALQSSRVERCDVIEYLPEVIDWMKTGLVPLSNELNSESRFHVINDDVYARLAAAPGDTYDLILIDVDHSPDENLGTQNSGFYTTEGLLTARKHLKENGILGVWSYADSSPFVDAMHEAFTHVHCEQVTVFNNLINEEQTDWLFFGHD